MKLNASSILSSPGKPSPMGCTYSESGTQFAVFSRHAEEVTLLLFEKPTDAEASCELRLDPELNKTGDVWHISVQGLKPGQLYGYRVKGPYLPKDGHRFNEHRLLVDPHAKALTGNMTWKLDRARGYNWNSPKKDLSMSTVPDAEYVPKSIVVDDRFDWGKDKHPRIPLQDTIIYETHLKGFTCHPSSKVSHKGKYAGLIEKIPYLKDLGITAVELLPVQDFDEDENFRTNPQTGEKLKNYWGYSTIAFFAPKGRYALHCNAGEQVNEFKQMVKALHEAGLEIILDVVFNHSAEGNEMGPTLCFRGFDNVIYYMLENGRYYKNYSGCGNTMNCNHPNMRDFILVCLRYWVIEMHVDGFRFDLASILGRDKDGKVLENPPLLELIAEDAVLRDTKIIAEAWDAAGLYQVGSFPGGRWAEWNGKYRDTLRAFWKGDYGKIGELATRIAGSSDLYQNSGRKPFHSINFITCHDGFTLRDLVSFNEKHNDANGEFNRDGENNNLSYNYGEEGDTDNPEIIDIRKRQRKNFLTSLFISQGVPMILAGDEFGKTQKGNNNPWCQDNDLSWIDWSALKVEDDFHRFVRLLIHFRKRHVAFRRVHFLKGKDGNSEIPDISWFCHKGLQARWDHNVKTIAFYLSGSAEDTGFSKEDSNFYTMINAHSKKISFRMPALFRDLEWKLILNTGKPSPQDIYEEGREPVYDVSGLMEIEGRSMIVLRNEL